MQRNGTREEKHEVQRASHTNSGAASLVAPAVRASPTMRGGLYLQMDGDLKCAVNTKTGEP